MFDWTNISNCHIAIEEFDNYEQLASQIPTMGSGFFINGNGVALVEAGGGIIELHASTTQAMIASTDGTIQEQELISQLINNVGLQALSIPGSAPRRFIRG